MFSFQPHSIFLRCPILKERMRKIENLQTDLADGLNLVHLLEIISSKSIRHNKVSFFPAFPYSLSVSNLQTPKMRIQMLENLNFCLDFLKKEGIKLVNIDSSVINEGNLKLILGLIWTFVFFPLLRWSHLRSIILRYQIQVSEGNSAKQELLEWVRSKIPECTPDFSHPAHTDS